MAHVAQWKFEEIDQLSQLLTKNKIVGIADIQGIPAPQLQKMRENIRAKAQIRCAKNSLILRALDEVNKEVKGIEGLKGEVNGQSVIIATDINPFTLFKELKKTRTMAPAKGGETATYDIEVKEGATPFKPGPIVGELQKAGIPAAIQEGKVVIKNDKVIVHAGEKIPKDVAQMLTRLEIFPIEIGMNLHAVFEEGTIYKPDVLDIDLDGFMSQLQQASSNALCLALETAWVNTTTIHQLIQKAHQNAHTLALEKNILTKDTVNKLLGKANASMLSLASRAQDALDDELKKKLT
jgi:large subunit ribosomal protein L10